ncbi:MAG: gluconate 2-dehydrogenase gamma chain [Woeseiaceae bacterium]
MDRRTALKSLGLMFGTSLIPPLKAAIDEDFDPILLTGADIFTSDQRADIEALSEIILPETDTPGASEAQVLNYIESMLQEWYSLEHRKNFMNGLNYFQNQCFLLNKKPFNELKNELQLDLIVTLNTGIDKTNYNIFADFFEEMRQLTITGYYTSETGMTVERHYLPIPGKYDGAYPYNKIKTLFTS